MAKKILVIKMSALGDLFMALPHLDAILARHGRDRVWLVTGPALAPLFDHHPALQAVVLDRRRAWGETSSWGRTLWVRHQGFDAVYDLQGNRTSRRLVRFCRAPVRVGTQPRSVYTAHPEQPYTQKSPQNVFGRLNDTLAAGGLAPAEPWARLYPGREDKEAVASWKAANGLADHAYVLIHAGSSPEWPSKRWPIGNFARLAAMIEARGGRCVWIGGPDEAGINRQGARTAGIDATGAFSLLQLYLLGTGAAFAVTNDSGPMHLLAAAGIAVFAFFGPTSAARSHAAGQGDRVLERSVPCRPCFSGCCTNRQGHICLDPIDPEKVFARVAPHLSRRKDHASERETGLGSK